MTRFEYDTYGRQVAVIGHATNENGTWVSYRIETEYDSRGRREVERTHVRAVWSANPNSAGSTATYTVDAGSARETQFTYDAQGRMTKTTFADQSYTTNAYDDFDRKVSETDAVGQTTAYEYDEQDRLDAVVQPIANVHGLILYKRLHLPRTPLQFALAVTTFNLLKEALAPEITEVQNGVYDEYIDEHVETKIENILITAGVLTAAFYLAKAAGAGAAAQRFGQFAMSFVTSFSFRFGF